MAEAAERDRIARQYVTDFDDVFELGEPVLKTALPRLPHPGWAALSVYLAFLASFPDSHVVRKFGAGLAEDTRRTAGDLRARWEACEAPERLLPDLLAWDADLKGRGINPGTSADLTVATLFVDRLQNILPLAARSG